MNESIDEEMKTAEARGGQAGSAETDVVPEAETDVVPEAETDVKPESEADTEAAIEALLFATGRAVGSDELGRALGMDTASAREAAKKFAERWNEESHGTMVIGLDDAWQMCTRKEYYPQLIALELHPRKPKLTDVLLETLSVVAYKQPVTKAEIERIRGVNSDHAVNRLVEYELVKELGRAKLPGRPILFGTTEEFLRAFGVNSREALPEINPVQLEDFRTEAEAEVGV